MARQTFNTFRHSAGDRAVRSTAFYERSYHENHECHSQVRCAGVRVRGGFGRSVAGPRRCSDLHRRVRHDSDRLHLLRERCGRGGWRAHARLCGLPDRQAVHRERGPLTTWRRGQVLGARLLALLGLASPSFVRAQTYDTNGALLVHVVNPTQGAELALLGVGFICGAIFWRMCVGRW